MYLDYLYHVCNCFLLIGVVLYFLFVSFLDLNEHFIYFNFISLWISVVYLKKNIECLPLNLKSACNQVCHPVTPSPCVCGAGAA